MFILKENEETYFIVTAKIASHIKDQIKWEDGKFEQYKSTPLILNLLKVFHSLNYN